MSIDTGQLLDHVIVPTLDRLELYSVSAERLLLVTAEVESRCSYLAQVRGPALGLWQVEPATHDDCWRWLGSRPELADKVRSLMAPGPTQHRAQQMAWNLRYACAMARIKYRTIRAALPGPEDAAGHAAYWKQWYNTPLGAGRPETFERAWHKLLLS